MAFVLSLMNEKEVLLWKGHFINEITNTNMKINFLSFTDFLALLEHVFKPANQASEAMNKLELLQQGNH